MRAFFVFFLLLSVVAGGCSRSSGSSGTGKDNNRSETIDESMLGLNTQPINLRSVNFEFDSAELTPFAQAELRRNAKQLLDAPQMRVTIEGHCDSRGTNEYNLALGEKRASSVYNFLRALGVNAPRLSMISYGEERPLDPKQIERAWAKNRRAQFVATN